MELSKQGIGFLLLAVLGIAYLRKDRALADSYQKRVEDNNRLAAVIEATNAAAKALEVTSENRSKVIEAVGESTRAAAEAIRAQNIATEQARSVLDQNKELLVRMNTQMQYIQRALDRLAPSEGKRASDTKAVR